MSIYGPVLSVELPYSLYGRMLAFAQMDPSKEIGGVMRLSKPDDTTLRVESVELLQQEVSGGSVDVDPNAITEWVRENGFENGKPKEWGFWHSHGKMGVFWSGTDEKETIARLASIAPLLNIVVNTKGEYLARIDVLGRDTRWHHQLPMRLELVNEIPEEEYLQMLADKERLVQKYKVGKVGYLGKVWDPEKKEFVEMSGPSYNKRDLERTMGRKLANEILVEQGTKKEEKGRDLLNPFSAVDEDIERAKMDMGFSDKGWLKRWRR